MNAPPRRLLRLVVPLVVMSMVLAQSHAAPLMLPATTACGASPVSPCCCGMTAERCCGMACCTARQSPVPTPSAPRNDRDTRESQPTPPAICESGVSLNAQARGMALWQTRRMIGVCLRESGTLHARGVRLNV